jgi:hypothetical protein
LATTSADDDDESGVAIVVEELWPRHVLLLFCHGVLDVVYAFLPCANTMTTASPTSTTARSTSWLRPARRHEAHHEKGRRHFPAEGRRARGSDSLSGDGLGQLNMSIGSHA